MPSPRVLNQDTIHLGYFDLSKKELRNPVAQNLSADPGSPVEGQYFWRSDTKTWRVWNGSAWIDLLSSANAIATTLVDAKGDLIVATADNTVARKAVGANNTFLTADSAQADGLAWRALVAADLQEKIATADLTDWPRAANLDINGFKITGAADGTAATDYATFGQLNAVVNSKQLKDTVDAATTAALPAVTATTTTLTATANGALAAQDGVTLAANDSLLVKNQVAGAQNGIYTVTQVGNAGAPFILTRRSDANTAALLTDATTLIDGGTDGKGDIYTFPTITTLGTTDATPVKTGEGNAIYSADGTTLTLTGTQFSVTSGGITGTQLNASVAGNGLSGGGGSALAVNAGTGLEINADNVRIAATAAGNGLTGGGGSALAVNAGSGVIADGTSTRVDPAVVVKAASGVLTGGANSEVLTHNLNTRKIRVTLRNNNSPWDEVEIANEATTVNTTTVYAATGGTLPAGYSWVVMGVQ